MSGVCFSRGLVIVVTAALLVACDGASIEGGGGGSMEDGGGWVQDGAPAGDTKPGTKSDAGNPKLPPKSKEICGNSFDDDMDGQVDEGCGCKPGTTQKCLKWGKITVQGLCKWGKQSCTGSSEFGKWGPCTGGVTPVKEICDDKLDQDCDGKDLPCPKPFCGDGKCNKTENCATCPKDCGKCPTKCDHFIFAVSARPVDIVWIIDQSGSMGSEIAGVKQNMNNFSNYISGQKIDYRVIVLAKRGTGSKDICIKPPLGGANCGDSARFKQVSLKVGSTNELTLFKSNIKSIESFMRPNSLRQIVVVSDDNSSLSAPAFHAWIKARTGYKDYVFHSIVSLTYTLFCTAKDGKVYIDLSNWTKGLKAHICTANWNSLFTQLSKKVSDVAKTQYKLSKTPLANTIKVQYNNVYVKHGQHWIWDVANSQVVLKGKLPGPGTKIKVCYQYTN